MNKTALIVGGSILGLILIIGLYLGTSYNNLVTLNESIDTQWAQVESQYQRRFDLIPNLVNSVQGVMTQEQKVFTALAEARTRYSGAATVDQKVAAAGEVETALARLLVVVENYPQLNSNQNVLNLQTQLEGTENRIAVERMRFNETIQAYNVFIKRFPTTIVAGLFGFDARTYFESQAGAETAPTVKLN